MKAVKIQQVNEERRLHLQAFLNFSVKAEKKKGKYKSEPIYKKFKKFFDYDKRLKEVLNGENLKNENLENKNKNSKLNVIGRILNKNKKE